MYSNIIRNNIVNGAGTLFEGTCPGRCPVVEQHYFGCLQKTART